jgi:hypothetical protein
VQNLKNAIQTQKPHHGNISRRSFLCILATFPVSLQVGGCISYAPASSIRSHEPNSSAIGLQLLAETLLTNFPKQYAELKAQLNSGIDVSYPLTKELLMPPQKVANEFENNEYIVIDGCMFSKSELQLSILVAESQILFFDLS